MPKYIIKWDAGYGFSALIIEADSMEKAQEEAYQAWLDEAESQAIYDAYEYSEELAEELGAE